MIVCEFYYTLFRDSLSKRRLLSVALGFFSFFYKISWSVKYTHDVEILFQSEHDYFEFVRRIELVAGVPAILT